MDMWPAQALETYQCFEPSSRSKCGTNPSTDIAGLGAVLSRALALPASVGVSSTTTAAWAALKASLPPLTMAPSKKVKGAQAIQPLAPGYTQKRHNSENTALYAVHPFRCVLAHRSLCRCSFSLSLVTHLLQAQLTTPADLE